ncbi:putative nitrate transport protein NrtA [Gluconacetobacter diazotrophicus PA1 5]|uniref:ABC transporter substrate-binding protein n=2 Tax=Gluconacetobacter diazotrophicus TaxID=33996 RepID=A0A7W4NNA5_GLUDI|nr:ABC transporter substrate-binding protein [Gluconacetobacter diazotrophicus]ACI50647.1 putative nitrate transport protein NrtA [Gluconacetobacter diazotrophicus PA1 5]MBB2157485.1 ABC transporter substrate-binding protein [Gluconacetobacter diazotrophicus]TWB09479.1 NitT/TauT family transport system substrate-binding protein [Gluconacetobacter diazotrophicus]CAP56586.1 putative nitrate transport protein nrtA [Gluconacetobacter diazotrophicus PA1 5]
MSELPPLSRRAALATAAGLALPFIGAGRAAASDGMTGDMACAGAAPGAIIPLAGPPRKLTIAWNQNSICTAAVPVAKAKGFFARHNLDIDYVNFAGSTDQLLEALATGKADGAPGMALRWLKPLQQGFDVKLVAGLHAGCLYLLAPPKGAVTQLADLRGKIVGVTDMGGPDRNFFGIRLKKIGIDPESEVQWRQYPPDLLPIALQRGEVQAITGSDPYSYLQKRQFGLAEIDSSMHGDWAHVACCVIGLRGSLIREEPQVAVAVTRAILDAGAWLSCNPDEAGRIFQPYAPRATAEDIAAMIRLQGHHHQARGGTFRDEIVLYANALKDIGVFRPSFDTTRFAVRVTQDLFSA